MRFKCPISWLAEKDNSVNRRGCYQVHRRHILQHCARLYPILNHPLIEGLDVGRTVLRSVLANNKILHRLPICHGRQDTLQTKAQTASQYQSQDRDNHAGLALRVTLLLRLRGKHDRNDRQRRAAEKA